MEDGQKKHMLDFVYFILIEFLLGNTIRMIKYDIEM